MAQHIPERQCVACRELKPKRELFRIVRDAAGNFDLDTGGKKAGRGAYICRTTECLTKAKKNHSLERSFKASITPDIYDKLAHLLDAAENGGGG